jgi:hypothetical protein
MELLDWIMACCFPQFSVVSELWPWLRLKLWSRAVFCKNDIVRPAWHPYGRLLPTILRERNLSLPDSHGLSV